MAPKISISPLRALVKKDLHSHFLVFSFSMGLVSCHYPDRPDVFSVASNRKLTLQTTRTFDYLGLSPNQPSGILHDSNMGSELVIGIIDSGIWPESAGFSDEGLGPIPKHWKGKCVAGREFDPAKHCNKKIVGARYYTNRFTEKTGKNISPDEYLSPRGLVSHGTECASIAAGAFVPDVSYNGLAPGLMRGAAPKARIAVYKVVFDSEEVGSGVSDCTMAIDDAINDGVDVLSISLGPNGPPYHTYTTVGEDSELGSFHAVMKGIPVVMAGSNSGPGAYTVSNGAPWMFTVGASTIDRSFYVDVTLGNNLTIPVCKLMVYLALFNYYYFFCALLETYYLSASVSSFVYG